MGIYAAYVFGILLPVILVVVGIVVFGTGLSQMARGSGDSDAIGGLMGLGVTSLIGIAALMMMALMVYVPAALARFALTGRFAAGFEVMENVAFIRRNALNYVLSLVLYLIGSFLARFGVFLCCVGMFPISFSGPVPSGLGPRGNRATRRHDGELRRRGAAGLSSAARGARPRARCDGPTC